ncbi:MAG: hypothetical protein OXG39_09830 [Chloroflexi bacterium]|nr:hypothetical protein [Chloroflexota bacterium]
MFMLGGLRSGRLFIVRETATKPEIISVHLLMAASMVMTLPSILVFMLLQRYYIQGVVISSGSK